MELLHIFFLFPDSVVCSCRHGMARPPIEDGEKVCRHGE